MAPDADESLGGFLSLTFEGGRFESHAAPVAVLAELASVQQLLVKVARQIYFAKNPGRRRMPRGFSEASQLYLSASKHNCFTAVLERPGTRDSLGKESEELFVAARDLALEALISASESKPLPGTFPSIALETLASLGRRLGSEEDLLFRAPQSKVARIDQQSRSYLAKLTHRPLERIEDVEGEVEEIDDATGRCKLRTRDGTRIEIPFEITERESFLEAMQARPVARVRARGTVSVSKMSKVEDLEVVDDERAGEVQRIWDRLVAFRSIGNGWCEGEGVAVTDLANARVKSVIARLLVENPSIPAPSIYPTLIGGIQAEWKLGPWVVDLEFPSDDTSIQIDATHYSTGEEKSEVFGPDLLTMDNVSRLAEWLKSQVADHYV